MITAIHEICLFGAKKAGCRKSAAFDRKESKLLLLWRIGDSRQQTGALKSNLGAAAAVKVVDRRNIAAHHLNFVDRDAIAHLWLRILVLLLILGPLLGGRGIRFLGGRYTAQRRREEKKYHSLFHIFLTPGLSLNSQ